jgi:hypothetical protein
VGRNSSYDAGACRALGLKLAVGRYWDAVLDGAAIELKKGKSIWIDLVRVAEQVTGSSEEARRETVTLFLIPDSERRQLEAAHLVPTGRLIDHLRVTPERAEVLLELKRSVPRSLNAQASLTVGDVRDLAVGSITW